MVTMVLGNRGFGEQGEKGIYFRGTWEQMPHFKGNRGTKTILGNRDHKKTNFRFLGNRGTSQFISGGTREQVPPPPPPPLEGPQQCDRYSMYPIGFLLIITVPIVCVIEARGQTQFLFL